MTPNGRAFVIAIIWGGDVQSNEDYPDAFLVELYSTRDESSGLGEFEAVAQIWGGGQAGPGDTGAFSAAQLGTVGFFTPEPMSKMQMV